MVTDLGVHPRELDAWLARREQAIARRSDAVVRTARVGAQDRVDSSGKHVANASVDDAGPAGGRLQRASCTSTMNHNDASTELNSGCPPFPGNVFGMTPSESRPAHSLRICAASSRRSVARQMPRVEMNVSRPQSPNHG